MPNLLRLLIRIIAILVIAFFLIQPYNWYCNIFGGCKQFSISDLIPKREGTYPLDVFFEITNYNEDLAFESENSVISTVSNRKNTVTYHVRNNSEKFMRFRPKLQVEPPLIEDYINFHDCLCFHEVKLKKGEEKTLTMEFTLKRGIEAERYLRDENQKIKIRYAVNRIR